MSEEQEGQVPQDPHSGQSSQQNFNQGAPFPPQGGGFGFGNMQQALPNATAVLILGILSIATCCCYGVIGLILGIIALVLSKKDKALYSSNPSFYTESSLKNLNAGRVCAIIGLVLNALTLVYYAVILYLFGTGVLSDPQKIQELIRGLE